MTIASERGRLRLSEAADYARGMLSFEMAVARYQIRTYNPFAHQLRGLLHGELWYAPVRGRATIHCHIGTSTLVQLRELQNRFSLLSRRDPQRQPKVREHLVQPYQVVSTAS